VEYEACISHGSKNTIIKKTIQGFCGVERIRSYKRRPIGIYAVDSKVRETKETKRKDELNITR